MASRRSIIALNVDAPGQLPTEFRLFVNGWNDTENGRFLFDAAAAESVMAAYESWGVDLAIDLEHQMVDPAPSPDPTAKDARGWCKLALRPDGSLWAVDVRWTPDGAERLSQKRQRYISPCFEIDPESKRVTKIINVAITAIPATHHTPALVAASVRGTGMDKDLVVKALDALEAGDAKAALDILKGLIAAAASGDADAATEDAPPPMGDGGSDEMTESVVAAAPPADAADAPAADGEDDKKEQKAASAVLLSVTGKSTLMLALAEIETWKKSHVELESERQKLAAERAVLDAADRRKLLVELVQLGAEFPSTVWADAKASKPKARWQNMPLAELHAHVDEQRAARGGKRASTPAPATKTPPATSGDVEVSTAHGTIKLSATEIANCAAVGADVKVYAANKAARLAARGGK